MSATLPASLIDLAARVLAANRAAGRRVALVESCTGGLVAAALTEIAGSSDVLECSFVTYANAAKVAMLGVPQATLDRHGAVSSETAHAMALGALAHSSADVAVAITGIAGPAGGSAKKPVGTVCFARARRGQDEVHIETRQFGDLGRAAIRLQAALVALELLLP
ncbi:MAG: CinA family protein [Alphaproteobacteria bacterium]|nr:CinA family protein [Alphaproteobacteria bacterium]MDE2042226.1 CinA family protein [Alphaproteobacteria bacterium]MDE2340878.1 CinA family protein [Alphaproteobacteria bacterium]